MVQQRVVMSIMGFVSIAVSYAMRACLSVAITEMTEPIKNTNTGNQSTVCGVLHSPTSHANKAANTVSESTEKKYRESSNYNIRICRMGSDTIGRKKSKDGYCHRSTLATF